MNDTKSSNIDDICLSKISKEVVEDQSMSTVAVDEDVEKLQTFAPEPVSSDEEPPNGGFAAWVVVFAAFCGQVAEFGVNYTWGVYLNHYNTEIFPGQLDQLSWIGSICAALIFSIGPFNEYITSKLGYTKMLAIGNLLCPLSLMLASLSTQIWHLYLTQGVMFGIGASFVFFPCLAAPQQWFTTRRGFAVGLTMSGSGIGGLVFSNFVQASIANLGFRWALRIEGFVCFALMLICTALVKAPPNAVTLSQDSFAVLFQKQKRLVLGNRQFQYMIAIGIVTTFGYLIPAFYLAPFANTLNLSETVGANLGGVMSGVNFISMLSMGWISDRIGRINGFFLCTFLSGFFTLVLWTTAKSDVSIWIYAVLYGFFGGGYISLQGASLPQVAGYDNISAANGLSYFTSTLGYLFGSPIASTIISTSGSYVYAAVYSGVLMTVGGLIAWKLRVDRADWKPLTKV